MIPPMWPAPPLYPDLSPDGPPPDASAEGINKWRAAYGLPPLLPEIEAVPNEEPKPIKFREFL